VETRKTINRSALAGHLKKKGSKKNNREKVGREPWKRRAENRRLDSGKLQSLLITLKMMPRGNWGNFKRGKPSEGGSMSSLAK